MRLGFGSQAVGGTRERQQKWIPIPQHQGGEGEEICYGELVAEVVEPGHDGTLGEKVGCYGIRKEGDAADEHLLLGSMEVDCGVQVCGGSFAVRPIQREQDQLRRLHVQERGRVPRAGLGDKVHGGPGKGKG